MTEKGLNKKVGENIKKYRLLYSINNEINFTQKKLAEKIGVSVSLIGALESNKNGQGISIYNLYKISKVLGISINKFFE